AKIALLLMVVDFRRAQSGHSPLFIDGSSVEIVKSTKFLKLRKAHPPPILTMFYRGTIESILSSCITAWFGNCTVSDRKTLQRIVRTAEKIIGVSLPSIMDIYSTRCIRKANSIVDDPTHPTPHTHSSPSCHLERATRSVLELHTGLYTTLRWRQSYTSECELLFHQPHSYGARDDAVRGDEEEGGAGGGGGGSVLLLLLLLLVVVVVVVVYVV
ncbi:hypothetical protein QTP70_031906, partial [Hemibagrus guttatus]